MNKNTLKIVKRLLNSYSIETTPNVYAKYGKFSDIIDKDHSIYITYLPDEDNENVIQTAKKLSLEGFDVIPHLPARTIENKEELELFLGKISEQAGCSKILIIGGGGKQKGTISSSIEVLETDLLSKFNFKEVGVAGHPEGSPDINENDLNEAIIQKNNFALNADFKIYLTTQFFFEAKSLINWEKKLSKLGNKLEIRAGLPGPASIKTLISYARSCGIGNSLRFISKQALNLTKLATTSTPDKLIYDLADYKNSEPNSKFNSLHFYAFGGMKKTSEWLNKIKKSELNYNSNNKFEF